MKEPTLYIKKRSVVEFSGTTAELAVGSSRFGRPPPMAHVLLAPNQRVRNIS